MKITLLRHGKPNAPSLEKLSAADFRGWVREYNDSGLDLASEPTHEALACAEDCNAIVCSNLPRSIDSGNALNPEKVILKDSIFNEAGLPTANWHKPNLSPKLWAVFFRVLWLFGYSRDSESFKEAKYRAVKAVEVLMGLADEHSKVVFVGHGVYDRILANELRRSGWVGPKNPGSKHWSYGVYKR